MCKECLLMKCVDVVMIQLGFSEEEITTFKHFFVQVVLKVLMAMADRKPKGNGRAIQNTDSSNLSSSLAQTESRSRPPRVQILFEKGYREIEDLHRSMQIRQLELRREELLIARERLLREREELQRRIDELEVENQRLRRLNIRATRELQRALNLTTNQGTQLRVLFGKEFMVVIKALDQNLMPDEYIGGVELIEFLDTSSDDSSLSSDYEDDCDYDSGAESWNEDAEYN